MQRRLVSVVLFAVLAAAVSSTLLYKVMTANSRPKVATTRVLVAVRDLDAGTMVGEGDVRSAEWPAVEGSRWIEKPADVVGRALLTPVAKDEPFADARLAAKGAGAGIASRIPTGMRVIAVHVDELTGLSRFILPGMHVDVISTGSQRGQSADGVVARTILQNIEVFSSGQSVERDDRDKATALPVFDLLVTPQEAETLSQAVAQARIELVLRNPLDKANFIPDIIPEKIATVIAQTQPAKIVPPPAAEPIVEKKPAPVEPPPPPPPPPAPTVEVIHGTNRAVSVVAPVARQEAK